MKHVRTYQTPDNWEGGICPLGKTNSFNVYMKSWTEMNEALEKLTGMEVTGFGGNDITLQKVVGKTTNTVSIPLWFAKILTQL